MNKGPDGTSSQGADVLLKLCASLAPPLCQHCLGVSLLPCYRFHDASLLQPGLPEEGWDRRRRADAGLPGLPLRVFNKPESFRARECGLSSFGFQFTASLHTMLFPFASAEGAMNLCQ